MKIRVINGPQTTDHQGRSITVTKYQEGIEFELSTSDESGKPIILRFRLPEDGEHVYQMNDKGDTTDSWHWPPRGDWTWPSREQVQEIIDKGVPR